MFQLLLHGIQTGVSWYLFHSFSFYQSASKHGALHFSELEQILKGWVAFD